MPKAIIEKFQVEYLSILNHEGNVDTTLEPKIADTDLIESYKLMTLVRRLDEKAVNLQRQGKMGTYPPIAGHEACHVGPSLLMKKEDWLVPHYRENLLYLKRGIPAKNILLYWMGDERANKMPEGIKNLPFTIPIGSQMPLASGLALAAKIKKEKSVTVCYFGDGTTSEGDFHEALNFAGVYQLPIIFICMNNGYAISTRMEHQTAAATYAQKAIAYGFEGIKVDGNDALAVYVAFEEAMKKARAGRGPTLIECETYRLGAHTTSDDPTKYRSETEVKGWEEKDPIKRFKLYIERKGLWTKEKELALEKENKTKIEKIMEEIEATPEPKPEEIFDEMYASLPKDLEAQKQELLNYLKNKKQ